ncbi:hypothetical protein EJ07DRAFT_178189 [Lizonia empirigonia]|nr:hypothetical protein EJ07DRAFT_178189 [Lizonia empirigonia]
MFHFRPSFILSFVLFALLVTTVTAGRHKPSRTCDSCFAKVRECKKNCKNMTEDSCTFTCECDVGKADNFCRVSCELGGPESACQYFFDVRV